MLSVVILVGFFVAERAAPEPLIDFTLLDIPVIRGGIAIGSLTGIVMFGLTTYVPPLVQGVEGGSPVDAGVAVAAMSIGWPIGSVLGGRFMLRFGTRRIVVIGSALAALGCVMATQLPTFTPLWYAMLSTGVSGFGKGHTSNVIMVSTHAVT